MATTQINFEITVQACSYKYVRALIEKICEDHEQKRDLHIKANILHPYIDDLVVSPSDTNAS